VSAIETFRRSWGHARGLTYDFISAVPEGNWEYSPHPRYAPFNKQVRHLVCVQGVYIDGIRKRATDFGAKHSHYGGGLGRKELEAALREKDATLESLLAEIPPADEAGYLIEFYGTNTLAGYLNVFLHHEAMHHGQWSFYATLGGFPTPQSWQLNWGL
jgi:uncharacterized damage-inducible protein DinB